MISPAQLAYSRIAVSPEEKTIIFLHDSLGCITLWHEFPEQLCRALSVNGLVYDRQGHGQSPPLTHSRTPRYLEEEADDLIALMDYHGIGKAMLFGHSDGGSIALIAAAKYPDRMQAVVAEAAHVLVEDMTITGIERAVQQYEQNNLAPKLKRYHGAKTNALFYAWAHTWTSPGFYYWNIEYLLPDIKCPVLVIQGADDEYGSDRQVSAIVNAVSGFASSFIIPMAGHIPHRTHTEAVTNAVQEFLQSNK